MMMGRTFSVIMDAISVSAAKSLIELATPDDVGCYLVRASITQEASVLDEMLVGEIIKSTATGTGTAATPITFDPKGPASVVTAKTNLTVEGSTPTAGGHREAFHIKSGLLWVPTPEERIWVPGNSFVALKLDKAPSVAMTITAVLVFSE